MHCRKSIYLLFTFVSTTDFKSIASINKEITFRNVYFVVQCNWLAKVSDISILTGKTMHKH